MTVSILTFDCPFAHAHSLDFTIKKSITMPNLSITFLTHNQTFSLYWSPGYDDLQSSWMSKESFDTLRVVECPMSYSTTRRSHCQLTAIKQITWSIPKFSCLIHQLQHIKYHNKKCDHQHNQQYMNVIEKPGIHRKPI